MGKRELPARSEISDAGRRRILFIFLDGVGIGSSDPSRNPFAAATLPNIRELFAGRRPVEGEIGADGLIGDQALLKGIDANLGVDGLPQSGTGQTALLTGANAAMQLGRHFGPWVPTALRDFLRSESLFQAGRTGIDVGLANAYPRAEIDSGERQKRRPGAFPLAAGAAGLLRRDEESVRSGDAIVSSITTDRWRQHVDPRAPEMTAEEAAGVLVRLSAQHDLTIFAHFDTDYVGHRGDVAETIEAVERVDRFLGAVVRDLPGETTLIVTSDHGNIEEMPTRGHTRNPVLFIAVGKGSDEAGRRIHSITDVAPTILDLLGSRTGSGWGP